MITHFKIYVGLYLTAYIHATLHGLYRGSKFLVMACHDHIRQYIYEVAMRYQPTLIFLTLAGWNVCVVCAHLCTPLNYGRLRMDSYQSQGCSGATRRQQAY